RLTLPPIFGAELARFNELLYDARVRDVLARWNIALEDGVAAPAVATPGETPFYACTYTPPCGGLYNSSSCAEQTNWRMLGGVCDFDAANQYACCPTQKIAAQRKCGFSPATNPCGTEGSGGCAICWTHTYTSSCLASTPGGSITLKCIDGGGSIFMS